MSDYDSTKDTKEHIGNVKLLLQSIISELEARIEKHDLSKFSELEKPYFDEYTPKLKTAEYGSDEYKQFLIELKPALDHHYKHNRHHPEHFDNGINEMNLIDVIEMLCDWKASTLRTKNGDIYKSIKINKDRFGYSDHFENMLINTAKYLKF